MQRIFAPNPLKEYKSISDPFILLADHKLDKTHPAVIECARKNPFQSISSHYVLDKNETEELQFKKIRDLIGELKKKRLKIIEFQKISNKHEFKSELTEAKSSMTKKPNEKDFDNNKELAVFCALDKNFHQYALHSLDQENMDKHINAYGNTLKYFKMWKITRFFYKILSIIFTFVKINQISNLGFILSLVYLINFIANMFGGTLGITLLQISVMACFPLMLLVSLFIAYTPIIFFTIVKQECKKYQSLYKRRTLKSIYSPITTITLNIFTIVITMATLIFFLSLLVLFYCEKFAYLCGFRAIDYALINFTTFRVLGIKIALLTLSNVPILIFTIIFIISLLFFLHPELNKSLSNSDKSVSFLELILSKLFFHGLPLSRSPFIQTFKKHTQDGSVKTGKMIGKTLYDYMGKITSTCFKFFKNDSDESTTPKINLASETSASIHTIYPTEKSKVSGHGGIAEVKTNLDKQIRP